MQDRSLLQTVRDFVAHYCEGVRDRADSRNERACMSSHDIALSPTIVGSRVDNSPQ